MTYRVWVGVGTEFALWCPSDTANFSRLFAIILIAPKPAPTPLFDNPRMACYTPNTMSTILNSVPPDLLEQYMAFKISSAELGRITGFHPVAIRRAIKRPPRPKTQKSKTALIQARKAFRAIFAHLPPREIKRLANVSLSTANRIRKMKP